MNPDAGPHASVVVEDFKRSTAQYWCDALRRGRMELGNGEAQQQEIDHREDNRESLHLHGLSPLHC
jgi:hypothetical protein